MVAASMRAVGRINCEADIGLSTLMLYDTRLRPAQQSLRRCVLVFAALLVGLVAPCCQHEVRRGQLKSLHC